MQTNEEDNLSTTSEDDDHLSEEEAPEEDPDPERTELDDLVGELLDSIYQFEEERKTLESADRISRMKSVVNRCVVSVIPKFDVLGWPCLQYNKVDTLPRFNSDDYIILRGSAAKKCAIDELQRVVKDKAELYNVNTKLPIVNLADLYRYVTKNNQLHNDLKNHAKMLMWYTTSNPNGVYKAINKYNVIQKYNFWKCLLQNYMIYERINLDDIQNAMLDLEEQRINGKYGSFCYLLYLGIFELDGKYKHVFKFGKSNRAWSPKEWHYNKRFAEHFANPNYYNYTIVGVFKCGNESNLENEIKSYLTSKDLKIDASNWNGCKELFAIDNYNELNLLISMIKDFVDCEASIEKLQEVQEENKKLTKTIAEMEEEHQMSLMIQEEEFKKKIKELTTRLSKYEPV